MDAFMHYEVIYRPNGLFDLNLLEQLLRRRLEKLTSVFIPILQGLRLKSERGI